MKKYPNYINEQLIKGHGNPISVDFFFNLCQKAKNSICKIKYCGSGTGFFFK